TRLLETFATAFDAAGDRDRSRRKRKCVAGNLEVGAVIARTVVVFRTGDLRRSQSTYDVVGIEAEDVHDARMQKRRELRRVSVAADERALLLVRDPVRRPLVIQAVVRPLHAGDRGPLIDAVLVHARPELERPVENVERLRGIAAR